MVIDNILLDEILNKSKISNHLIVNFNVHDNIE